MYTQAIEKKTKTLEMFLNNPQIAVVLRNVFEFF